MVENKLTSIQTPLIIYGIHLTLYNEVSVKGCKPLSVKQQSCACLYILQVFHKCKSPAPQIQNNLCDNYSDTRWLHGTEMNVV